MLQFRQFSADEPADPFPQPRRRDGEEPCGECRLPAGETCDICGAVAPDEIGRLQAYRRDQARAELVRRGLHLKRRWN